MINRWFVRGAPGIYNTMHKSNLGTR